jgi:hypothetical protein
MVAMTESWGDDLGAVGGDFPVAAGFEIEFY